MPEEDDLALAAAKDFARKWYSRQLSGCCERTLVAMLEGAFAGMYQRGYQDAREAAKKRMSDLIDGR